MAFIMVAVCWLVWLAGELMELPIERLGVWPKAWKSLGGIFTMLFVHGSLQHLYSNSLPLFFFTAAILYFFPFQKAWKALLFMVVLGGFGLWIIGRPSWHIGASGLIYAEAAFIIANGMVFGHTRLLAVSLLILLYYGTMWIGLLPLVPGMSWEGHLSGAMAGVVAAIVFRQPPAKNNYDWGAEAPTDLSPKIDDYIEVKLPHQKSDN